MTLRISLVSDLHLEFSDINIQNNKEYDVLILGGDIMVAQDMHDHPEPANTVDQAAIANGTGLGRRQQAAQRFRDFLKRCSSQFPHVVYVAGNHEFYHGKFFAGVDYLRAECAKYPNVYFLEKDTKIIDDVVFVGGTLWTNMNRQDPITMQHIVGCMNDFSIIRNDKNGYARLHPRDVVERHYATLRYIETVVEQHKDKQCVVVGHHSPSFLSVDPQYSHETLMNGGYHSDLSEFILDHPQIVLWTCGHTHHAHWYHIGDTLITCNPRGYQSDGYSEDTGWNPNFVIDLEHMPDKDYVSKNYDDLF